MYQLKASVVEIRNEPMTLRSEANMLTTVPSVFPCTQRRSVSGHAVLLRIVARPDRQRGWPQFDGDVGHLEHDEEVPAALQHSSGVDSGHDEQFPQQRNVCVQVRPKIMPEAPDTRPHLKHMGQSQPLYINFISSFSITIQLQFDLH